MIRVFLSWVLAVLLLGCQEGPTSPQGEPSTAKSEVPTFASDSSRLRAGQAPVAPQANPEPQTVKQSDNVWWVMNHRETDLWNDWREEGESLGKAPAWSWLLVEGPQRASRLPVHYFGNNLLTQADAWVSAADVGPVAEPPPGWAEPPSPRAIRRPPPMPEWTEVQRGDPSLPRVAVTLDAGDVAGSTAEVLQVLRERGLQITFFVAGTFAERYPDLMAQMAEDGHEIANHSYSHPDLRTLSDDEIERQFRRAEEAIVAASGRTSRPYFRPPFGGRNARVLSIAAREGYRSVYWTLDSGDWLQGATVERIASKVLGNAGNGDIVVAHSASPLTAAALPTILDGLKARGLEVVTVTDLLFPE